MKVVLDMDEVLVDFMGGLCELLRLDFSSLQEEARELPERDALWQWISNITGYTPASCKLQAFELINRQGQAFWTGLRPFSWTVPLWELCHDYADEVIICTDCSWTPWHSVPGKMEWVNQHLDSAFDRFVFTRHKELLAEQGVLLIDDHWKQIIRFGAEGGRVHWFLPLWRERDTRQILKNVRGALSKIRSRE